MYLFSHQLDEDVFYNEARFELAPTLRGMKSTLTLGATYERSNGSLALCRRTRGCESVETVHRAEAANAGAGRGDR